MSRELKEGFQGSGARMTALTAEIAWEQGLVIALGPGHCLKAKDTVTDSVDEASSAWSPRALGTFPVLGLCSVCSWGVTHSTSTELLLPVLLMMYLEHGHDRTCPRSHP